MTDDRSDRRDPSGAGPADEEHEAVDSTRPSSGARGRNGSGGNLRSTAAIAVRHRIVELLAEAPDASLRDIARTVGASPETVRDVRLRVHRGDDPLPAKLRARVGPVSAPPALPSVVVALVPRARPSSAWSRDTACSSTPQGASFASWFDSNAVGNWATHVHDVPLGRVYDIVDEAHARAADWAAFAERLAKRVRT